MEMRFQTADLSALLPHVGKRVVVAGTSGSGKTTLAKQIASLRHIPYIELDALWLGPHWSSPSTEEFQRQVAEQTLQPAWIVDGTYSSVREMLWEQADTLLWLDYSLWTTFWRTFRRSIRRCLTRELLFSGNQETFRRLFSKDSILLWVLRTHGRRKREFQRAINQPKFTSLRVLRIFHP